MKTTIYLIILYLLCIVEIEGQVYRLNANALVISYKSEQYEYPRTNTILIQSENASKWKELYSSDLNLQKITDNLILMSSEKVVSERNLMNLKNRLKNEGTLFHAFEVVGQETVIIPTNKIVFYSDNPDIIYKLNSSLNGMEFKIDPHQRRKNIYFISIENEDQAAIFDVCNKISLIEGVKYAEVEMLNIGEVTGHMNSAQSIGDPDDEPYYECQWYIDNNGTWSNCDQLNAISGFADADVDADEAWSNYTAINSIKVAIIDTGVDTSHEDLSSNYILGSGYDALFHHCTSCTGITDYHGAPSPDEFNGHGTSCAGIICAADNAVGLIGVAYNTKFIPIRNGVQIDQNTALISAIASAEAISYASDVALADVISCSWTAAPSSNIDQAIFEAVNDGRLGKGCAVIFSSGNGDLNSIRYPASNINTIAVGASTMCDERKRSDSDPMGVSCDEEGNWGSNYGVGLSVVAPGVKMYTTDVSGINGYSDDDYFTHFNGTSASTPVVVGAASQILAYNPNLSSDQLRYCIEKNSEKIPNYIYDSNEMNGSWNDEVGYGRVNVNSSILDLLYGDCVSPPAVNEVFTSLNGVFTDGSISQHSQTGSSLNFDYNYNNNIHCAWKISPIGGNSITLEFNSWDVADADCIKIYEGGLIDDNNLIFYYCNNANPGIVSVDAVEAIVVFETDDNPNGGLGWEISYTATSCGVSVSNTNPVCLNSNEYEIEFEFNGDPGHEYTLTSSPSSYVYSGVEDFEGPFIFGTFLETQAVTITVVDDADASCTSSVNVNSQDCDFCNINISNVETNCLAGDVTYDMEITFTGDAGHLYDIYSYPSNGANTHGNVAPGTYTISPFDVGAGYTVRVEDITDPNNCFEAYYFSSPSCVQNNLNVTWPNSAGQCFDIGSSQTITWSSTGSISNVNVEFCDANTGNCYLISSNTPNDGSYSWSIDGSNGEGYYYIKIYDPTNTSVNDIGHVFEILNDCTGGCDPLTVTLLSPPNGSQFDINENFTLAWDLDPAPLVGPCSFQTFEIMTADNSSFSNPNTLLLTSETLNTDSAYPGIVYWRIRAQNESDEWGPWSSSRMLTIIDPSADLSLELASCITYPDPFCTGQTQTIIVDVKNPNSTNYIGEISAALLTSGNPSQSQIVESLDDQFIAAGATKSFSFTGEITITNPDPFLAIAEEDNMSITFVQDGSCDNIIVVEVEDCNSGGNDFYISNESVSTSVVEIGNNLTLSCNQNYAGGSSNTLYVELKYFLSIDQARNSNDIYLNNDQSSLSINDMSDSESTTITVPAVTPGVYYILFATDDDDDHDETNENNNIETVQVTVQSSSSSSTFIVDSESDGGDAVPGDGDCDDGSGNCTLRAALEESNSNSNANTILFESYIDEISITSDLDPIIYPVTIDGGTTGEVKIDGAGVGDVLVIEADNCTLYGLWLKNCPDEAITLDNASNLQIGGDNKGCVFTNNNYSVFIGGDNSNNLTFQGNYFGTDINFNQGLGNSRGINVSGGSSTSISNIVVGGESNSGLSNYFCNTGSFALNLSNVTGADVIGNFFGTDPSGTQVLPNGNGLLIENGMVGGSELNKNIFAYTNSWATRTDGPGIVITHNEYFENGRAIEGYPNQAYIAENVMYCNTLGIIGSALDEALILTGSTSSVSGSCLSGAQVGVYKHFHASCPDNDYCQGAEFLGNATVSGTNWVYNASFFDGDEIVVLQHLNSNSTSYYSSCFVIDSDTYGCTDSTAHNYNPSATQDDGSCETCFDGIQNGDETGIDCGGIKCTSCGPQCPDLIVSHLAFDGNIINVSVQNIGNDTAIIAGGVILQGYWSNDTLPSGSGAGGFVIDNLSPDLAPNQEWSHFWSGSNSGNKPYLVMIVDRDNNLFECQDSNNVAWINVGDSIIGCTDSLAHNYDSNATIDDGSCETCTDAILNGDETEIDCGGILCVPCSSSSCQWTVENTGHTSYINGVFAANDSVVYSVGLHDRIEKSIDGGQNWTTLHSTGNFSAWFDTYFTQQDTGWVVGNSGKIWNTIDGQVWSSQSSGYSHQWYGVYFNNPNTGFACGENGVIIKTVDGGATWVPKPTGTTESIREIQFLNELDGYAVGFNGTCLSTNDAGETWGTVTLGEMYHVNDLYFLNENVGWVVGYNPATIQKTINGGSTWTKQDISNTQNILSICMESELEGYFVGVNGMIKSTVDGGANWIVDTTYTSEHLSVINRHGNFFIAGGSNGTFLSKYCVENIYGCIDTLSHNFNPLANVDNDSCQTCTDGVQNGDEESVDCGGTLCNPCLVLKPTKVLELNTGGVVLGYSDTVDLSEIESKISVYGSLTGFKTGTYSIADTTLIFNPDSAFVVGEVVHIISSDSLKSTNGIYFPLSVIIEPMTADTGYGQFYEQFSGITLSSPMTAYSYSFLPSDINRDGVMDIVYSYYSSYGANTNLLIYLGNGSGGYAAPSTYVGSYSHSSLRGTPDLNADGYPDVVTTQNAFPSSVHVRLNDGTGSFGAEAIYPVTNYSNGVEIADMNGDGHLDMIGRSGNASTSSNRISIFYNNGDGTFQPQATTNTSGFGRFLAPGDLDSDGDLDVVFGAGSGSFSGPRDIRVYSNDGTGSLTLESTNDNTALNSIYPYLFDFNGDDKLDLQISTIPSALRFGNDSFNVAFNNLSVLRNPSATYRTSDFDGDGDLDIFMPVNDTLFYFENDGYGNFLTVTSLLSVDRIAARECADMDVDKDADVIYMRNDSLFIAINGIALGCTDMSAHNYNPSATVDDGSCETCSDGVQNGDEIDIDCGGILCGPCSTSFVTTWQTTSNLESITIPTSGGGYNYSVNWGDGTTSSGHNGNATHTYDVAGTYSVSISGSFPRIYFNNSGDKDKIFSIDQWGIGSWTSMEYAFAGCSNLNGQASDIPDLSNVHSVYNMFQNTSLFNQDVSNWVVDSVRVFARMFNNANAFNQNLNNWNVSNAVDMNGMFFDAWSFDQNLDNWNIEGVSNMQIMFDFSNLSLENYDSILIAWGAQDVLQNVNFSALQTNYCLGARARAHLIHNNGWSITDSGMDASCSIPDCATFTTPLAGAVDVPINTNLSWTSDNRTEGYKLKIGTCDDCADIDSLTTYDTMYQFFMPLDYHDTIFLQIISFNENGEEYGCEYSYFITEHLIGCLDSNAHNYTAMATLDTGYCETCSDGIQNGDEIDVDCGGLLCSPCICSSNGSRWYVDSAAVGNNSGFCWDDAFVDLQDAIDAASAGDSIWVAKGTYNPEQLPDGTTGTDRHKAFHLNKNLIILGGFNGSEDYVVDRNVHNNQCFLSGDIGSIGDPFDNCYHVLIAANLDTTSLVDGFTICDGFANGTEFKHFSGRAYFENYGGGINNQHAGYRISNVIVKDNHALRGGGVYSLNCPAMQFTNMVFVDNDADLFGGGMYNRFSSPKVLNSVFVRNEAGDYGGGMGNFMTSTPMIINSTFFENEASIGGGMANFGTNNPSILNSIFLNNLRNGSSTIFGADIQNQSGSVPVVEYCSTQGYGTDGVDGIMHGNPIFKNSLNPVGLDQLWLTSDDGLQLTEISPSINKGNNTLLPSTLFLDAIGNPRVQYSYVDMGAYEFQNILFEDTCSYVTTCLDSLPGSLAFAVDCAISGDTLRFIPFIENDTIPGLIAPILFDKDLTIIVNTDQDIFLSGQYLLKAIEVAAGKTVKIVGLNLISSQTSPGVAIDNHGDLTLENVNIFPSPNGDGVLIQNDGTVLIIGESEVNEE